MGLFYFKFVFAGTRVYAFDRQKNIASLGDGEDECLMWYSGGAGRPEKCVCFTSRNNNEQLGFNFRIGAGGVFAATWRRFFPLPFPLFHSISWRTWNLNCVLPISIGDKGFDSISQFSRRYAYINWHFERLQNDCCAKLLILKFEILLDDWLVCYYCVHSDAK